MSLPVTRSSDHYPPEEPRFRFPAFRPIPIRPFIMCIPLVRWTRRRGNPLSSSTPAGWEDMRFNGCTHGTYGECWQHLCFGYVYESPRTAVGHHFARLPGSCSPERWAFTMDTFLVLEGQSVQFRKKLIRRLARGSSSRDLFYYLVRVHLACLVPPVHSSAPTEQGRPP